MKIPFVIFLFAAFGCASWKAKPPIQAGAIIAGDGTVTLPHLGAAFWAPHWDVTLNTKLPVPKDEYAVALARGSRKIQLQFRTDGTRGSLIEEWRTSVEAGRPGSEFYPAYDARGQVAGFSVPVIRNMSVWLSTHIVEPVDGKPGTFVRARVLSPFETHERTIEDLQKILSSIKPL